MSMPDYLVFKDVTKCSLWRDQTALAVEFHPNHIIAALEYPDEPGNRDFADIYLLKLGGPGEPQLLATIGRQDPSTFRRITTSSVPEDGVLPEGSPFKYELDDYDSSDEDSPRIYLRIYAMSAARRVKSLPPDLEKLIKTKPANGSVEKIGPTPSTH
jgi:hypothetical protein